MDPVMFGFFVLGATITAGVMAWRLLFSERARHRRAIKRAPLVSLGDVMEGASVRVTGTVVAASDELKEAPLSGRPCVLYDVEVDQRRNQGRNSAWVPVIREKDFVASFWLEDDSGRALVQFDWPEVVLTRDANFRSGILKEPKPRLREYLSSHGESAQGIVFNKDLRYREGALEPGEQVTVLGVAHLEPDPDPAATADGYRGRAMRLVLRSPEDGEMLLSDVPDLTKK